MGKKQPPKSVWARPPRPGVSTDRDKAEIDRQETHELTYLVARDEWLARHAPQLDQNAPSHECSFLAPGTAYGDELHFDELDDQGLLRGTRWLSRGRYAFGTPDEVITAVAGGRSKRPGWRRS